MGQLVYIKAKDGINLDELNKVLAKIEIQNSFTTEEDNISWLKDINDNPKSPQRHLKPKNRDLTMEELQEIIPGWTEVGLLNFDVAFSRTDEETAQKYIVFIRDNQDSIDHLKGALELIERYDVTPEDCTILKRLNKPEVDPVKLPKEQRTKHDLQDGLFLCKSWSTKPFWVIFGNVDKPMFMKDRIYEDDIYNNLYKDKQGYAYLMLPLLPLNDLQLSFVEKVYSEAWDMGLREAYSFIIPVIYGLDLTNYFHVCKEYQEFYTTEELNERFVTLMTAYQKTYGLPGGFIWSDVKKRFKPCGNNTVLMQNVCSILTCLVWAMGKEKAAELMSNMTGKKYLPFEFDIRNKLNKVR